MAVISFTSHFNSINLLLMAKHSEIMEAFLQLNPNRELLELLSKNNQKDYLRKRLKAIRLL